MTEAIGEWVGVGEGFWIAWWRYGLLIVDAAGAWSVFSAPYFAQLADDRAADVLAARGAAEEATRTLPQELRLT